MASHQKKIAPQAKPIVKRLLDGILPKRRKTQQIVISSSEDNTPSSVNEVVTRSSYALKKHEVVPTNRSKSPDPTLLGETTTTITTTNNRQAGERQGHIDTPLVTANSQFFYTPMYRRYFGLTPPNPQLCNPRLLEDYIDWYINVYMEEELPWQWINVDKAKVRAEQSEQEAKEEAEKLAATSIVSKGKN